MKFEHRAGDEHGIGPNLRRRMAITLLAVAVLTAPTACDEGQNFATAASPTEVTIIGEDYDFRAPDSIRGGLVEFTFKNDGNEPHFAGLARVLPGRSAEDVHAALTQPIPAAPPGPSPFEDFAGIGATDPGQTAKVTLNVPPGTYVLFCLVPSPDGTSHAHKGMVKTLTVGEGTASALPRSVATVVARDFAFSQLAPLKRGENVVRLRNDGEQPHEINLVELPPGKTLDEVVAWLREPAGPPPATLLGGVAVRPGEEGVATLKLKKGSTYAFVCTIPDVLGDGAPHVDKGMLSPPFTVR